MPDPQAYQVLRTLVKEVRVAAGLRQQDLADRLGAGQSFVSKYESGERRLDVLELREICSACGVSLASFVEQLEDRTREEGACGQTPDS
jgi:transcriptional regulator with XRE-family HTH domain